MAIPKGVDVTLAGGAVSVKGPLGTLTRPLDPAVSIEREGDSLVFKAQGDSHHAVAMSGTLRALLANMVTGVSKGFERRMTLVGVGYRAQAQGEKLNLTLGFSHPVVHNMQKGVKVATPTQTEKAAAAASTTPGPTSSRSARWPRKCARTGRPSPTRGKACDTQTRQWS